MGSGELPPQRIKAFLFCFYDQGWLLLVAWHSASTY